MLPVYPCLFSPTVSIAEEARKAKTDAISALQGRGMIWTWGSVSATMNAEKTVSYSPARCAKKGTDVP